MLNILSDLANIGIVVGAFAAIATLVYTAHQVRLNFEVARSNFALELEKMFAEYNDFNLKLRPGGEWDEEGGPQKEEDWSRIEDYMGLFEHCKLMLDKNLIDAKTFKEVFGYRIKNILCNKNIVKATLIGKKEHWVNFRELAEELGYLSKDGNSSVL